MTAAISGPAYADAVPYPGMNGPLAANPKPAAFDAGPFGSVNVTGVLSGIAQTEDHPFPGEEKSLVDLTNGLVFVQKTSGKFQFFIQAGIYSIPDLGAPYIKARTMTSNLFGPLPQAFVKLQPTPDFSIMVGKLPTLIGAESTFTFENLNIQRGLLWNQEPAVSRGVQANYAHGPLTVSVSLNDGYYSNKYSWISGSIAYALSKKDTITLVGAGNVSHSLRSTFATPATLNNGEIYNLILVHTSGPWIIEPYLQYSRVHRTPEIGIPHGASTFGAALLAKYSFTPTISVTARGEYISSTGSLANGAPSLLYGPGSKAWSLTVTPTYQKGIFFLRGELAHVGTWDTTPGYALGRNGLQKTQDRALVETGFLF
ncbi:MAG TPA: outer membrane beta-barrel protein [Sphingomicrobium sp.]|nr:outer membrane beta-barrel protein [Sphingomicrobium sp.]